MSDETIGASKLAAEPPIRTLEPPGGQVEGQSDEALAAPIGRRTLTEAFGRRGMSPGRSGAGSVGKWSRSSALARQVQMKEIAGVKRASDPAAVRAAASTGAQGAASALPHAPAIQKAFGKHDISGITAHVGGQAADAAAQIGAKAYAMGSQIVFAQTPDLHTAAHEAAHVIQQRAGVQLDGGVGTAGDDYERQADRIADMVVAGRSVEPLLDGKTAGAPTGQAVQRKEVETREEIKSKADWLRADRESLSGTFAEANEYNLRNRDNTQYTRIPERRDFYIWFYRASADRGFTTRWALAASLVANGADQVAYMPHAMDGMARMVGMVSDDLQAMMRIGNQVIFDNVFPKLATLWENPGPVTGAEALQWDMQTLSEEQALIQPLYSTMSADARGQMERIVKQQGLAGLGAWLTNGAHVEGAQSADGGTVYNEEGDMPDFEGDLDNVDARWTYGMEVGQTFTPGGTGWDPQRNPRPAASDSYTTGQELDRLNVRMHLHMLEARLDRTGHADEGEVVSILRQLTEPEQEELMTNRSPDGYAYTERLAAVCRKNGWFGPYVDDDTVAAMRGAINGMSHAERASFLATFDEAVEGEQEIVNMTHQYQMMPPF